MGSMLTPHPFRRFVSLIILAGSMLQGAWAAPPSLTPAIVVQRMGQGDWAKLTDEQLTQAVQQLGSEGIVQYLELGMSQMPEYELWMRRQERLAEGWNDKPFVNYLKYRHQPRQVYMSWLKGGPKAGQEILYDETQRKDAMYGHLAGVFNVMSIWTGLDSALAKSNSQHSVRDAGLQSVVEILRSQLEARRHDGALPAPDKVETSQVGGQRVISVTWMASTGEHTGYAHQTRLSLDVAMPVVRQVESWDAKGQLRERIMFERIRPTRFAPADFDPGSTAYSF